MKIRSSLFVVALLLGACGGGGGGGGQIVGGAGGGVAAGGGGGAPPPVGGGGGGLPSGIFFSFDTGIGGSGGLIGSVGGFGSIFVNGLEMETDDASFYIEGGSGSQNDLREGHRVVVVGDIGNLDAEEVHYRSNLKGPVSAAPVIEDVTVGRATLVVLGQTVRTNAETISNGVDLALLSQGDLIEVSGILTTTGEVIATYMEIKIALTEYKAIGVVTGLDTGAAMFNLGGLGVDYAAATFSDFDGAALANGQFVEVKMVPADFIAPASADAREVELLPLPIISEGAELEVEGIIDTFVSATDFRVNGVAVTTDGSTQFEDGTSASLALNVKVEVEGVANASGVIVAEEVKIKQTKAIRVEGTVTAVDVVAQTVTSLGVTFDVRPFTEIEDDSNAGVDPLTLADLDAGIDRVEIRGYLEGAIAVAVELEREDADTQAQLRGPVTAFNEGAGTVQILGVSLSVDGVTTYEDDDGGSIIRSVFFGLLQTGSVVSARWDNFSSLSDAVDQLELEDED